jgi:hypothetical protein
MTTAIEVNCVTGEITERSLTSEEIAQRASEALVFAAQQEEAAQAAEALAALKASAKAKLIAGAPLTAEEADTLVI